MQSQRHRQTYSTRSTAKPLKQSALPLKTPIGTRRAVGGTDIISDTADAAAAPYTSITTAIIELCKANGLAYHDETSCADADDNRILTVNANGQDIKVIITPVTRTTRLSEKSTFTVTVSCVIDNPAPGLLDFRALGKLNRYATLLSTVMINDQLVIFSKFTIHEDSDDYARGVFAPMATAPVWLAVGLSSYLTNASPNAYDFLVTEKLDDPSKWLGLSNEQMKMKPSIGPLLFKEAADLSIERGHEADADDQGLIARFEWNPKPTTLADLLFDRHSDDEDEDEYEDDGFYRSEWQDEDEPRWLKSKGDELDEGKSTIMIQIDGGHQLYGQGLLAQIRFGDEIQTDDLAEFVNDLNRWEMESDDLPPFFGSWCTDPDFAAPAYVMFIPAMFASYVTPFSLLAWAWGRHEALKTLMNLEQMD